MANNHSIQFLRKNGVPTDTELKALDAGQPLYDMTNNHFYIGVGNNTTGKLVNTTPAEVDSKISTAINNSITTALNTAV